MVHSQGSATPLTGAAQTSGCVPLNNLAEAMSDEDGQSGEQHGVVADRLRARHPGFRESVLEDARVSALHRGEPFPQGSPSATLLGLLRLCRDSDAFGAQVAYRAKASLQRRGRPILGRVAHRLAMMLAQVSIGDPVLIRPGVYVVHGGIVIDGITEVGSGTVIAPWVTIGLKAGNLQGPTIGSGVQIGTGAKILGPIRVGDGAVIGANAVVVSDVPAGARVVGVPAREVAVA